MSSCRFANVPAVLAGAAFVLAIPGLSQSIGASPPNADTLNADTVDLDDGATYNVTLTFNRPIAFGLEQNAGFAFAATLENGVSLSVGLAHYTANYTSFGRSYPFNIVGTDPSLGAATTYIPTVIVPIKLVFPNAGSPALDGSNVVLKTVNSPLFLTADYTTGGIDLGVTQYADAIQRAEFWNLPGFSTGYHVLLGPVTIAATVTVNVPAGKGNIFRLQGGGLVGLVDNRFFDGVLDSLIASGAFTPDQVPIFLTDNVFESANGAIQNCCVLGYHASQGPPIATAQTWIYAGYVEPGTFGGASTVDVQPLSHEVSEWINDPFVGTPVLGGINLIPPAILPGQGGACIVNFETGDPLEAPVVAFTQVTNGSVYHLQDEAFLSWFLHGPSFGVNGFYSFLGAFLTPSALCGPG